MSKSTRSAGHTEITLLKSGRLVIEPNALIIEPDAGHKQLISNEALPLKRQRLLHFRIVDIRFAGRDLSKRALTQVMGDDYRCATPLNKTSPAAQELSGYHNLFPAAAHPARADGRLPFYSAVSRPPHNPPRVCSRTRHSRLKVSFRLTTRSPDRYTVRSR